MTTTPPDHFETLTLASSEGIARVQLNRPDKANAMNLAMWHEIREAFTWIDTTPEARVAILSGTGKHFTSGIDLSLLSGIHADIADSCDGRQREKLRRLILDLQDTLTSLERCRKPVLAAIHGTCMGGGIDLICACDMRYCSADANFSVKEVDVGMTADVGTLQRLPRLIGEGEAQAIGLVNRCYATPGELQAGVGDLARGIAGKSPLAVRGSKEMISYTRDHSVADGLNYIATWNAAMLISDDLGEALAAAGAKRPAKFRD
ncbi:MAG: crotonase/enoyl-CoA hydratase family protein [Proteobacteria bacterium]|nr:crotonase/enoyl-CoA hydratase family protein [Pseudomonadota bacterium]